MSEMDILRINPDDSDLAAGISFESDVNSFELGVQHVITDGKNRVIAALDDEDVPHRPLVLVSAIARRANWYVVVPTSEVSELPTYMLCAAGAAIRHIMGQGE